MSNSAQIINAFSYNNRGGNPAAVILQGENYTPAQRQQLARQLALSETVFILGKTNDDAVKLAYHTPLRPIAFCGHATLAAFAALAGTGRLQPGMHTYHPVANNTHTPKQLELAGDKIWMQQGPASINYTGGRRSLAQALGLTVKQLKQRKVFVGSTGNPFLYAELADTVALRQITPDYSALHDLSTVHNVIGVYAFVRTQGPVIAAAARMFAPAYGIAEEAATGMAAGPLGAYLLKDSAAQEVQISQGGLMQPRAPSRIFVHKRGADIWVGGAYTAKASMSFTL